MVYYPNSRVQILFDECVVPIPSVVGFLSRWRAQPGTTSRTKPKSQCYPTCMCSSLNDWFLVAFVRILWRQVCKIDVWHMVCGVKMRGEGGGNRTGSGGAVLCDPGSHPRCVPEGENTFRVVRWAGVTTSVDLIKTFKCTVGKILLRGVSQAVIFYGMCSSESRQFSLVFRFPPRPRRVDVGTTVLPVCATWYQVTTLFIYPTHAGRASTAKVKLDLVPPMRRKRPLALHGSIRFLE